ncbi:prenyltransferase [Glutamicibacter sp. BW80]|uniref:prenyltransferase n=1 Tax=unclassified Glutamicibacter TaxID=2627139 RepID=UPI000BB840D5|nr:prenyltransferase [Glutamicibacter sp. BW80]PCC27438.1 prenyltransferase [Glutamicibacter sp. BW80]
MIRAILATSRPISWVNTAYPFAAAYLIAGQRIDWLLVLGTLFFLFPYNLLMYGVNDVFDYESDLRNPRKGGVEGAVLSRDAHRTILSACLIISLPFIAVLALGGTALSNAVLAASVAMVLAYSAPRLRFKERPGLDSLTSAVHFVSPAVYGWVLAGSGLTLTQWCVFGAFLLWGMASHALGAIQDIIPDRAGELGSIATVLGARITLYLVLCAYLLAGAVLLLGLSWPAAGAGLLAVPYVLNVLPHLAVSDASSPAVNAAWKRFLWINYLCGFLLTMLIIYTTMFA